MITEIFLAVKEEDGTFTDPATRELGVAVVGGKAYLQLVEPSEDGQHRRRVGSPTVVGAAPLMRALQAAIADDEDPATYMKTGPDPAARDRS